MKSIIEFIDEKLQLNKDSVITAPKKSQYFQDDDFEEYFDAVEKAISRYGYMCVRKTNHGYGIWVFKRGTQTRSQTLKNLICSIYGPTYIDWGPNERLKSTLEEPIMNAMNSIN